MSSLRVLIADNSPASLINYREVFELAGYHVIQAATASETRKVLDEERLHLAILDLRLVDDADEKDKSGLLLARDSTRTVPKIILTRFPITEHVREALKPDPRGQSIAVDFIDKRLELDELLAAVEQVIAQHIHINWNLVIHWRQPWSFLHLLKLIAPETESQRLGDRAEEIEDLFRNLFYDSDQIAIGSPLASGDGYVVVEIIAFDATGREQQFVVVCGRESKLTDEQRRFDASAPQQRGAGSTARTDFKGTMRFAAAAYQLIGADLERLMAFETYYRRLSAGEAAVTLEHLYRSTLAPWHDRGRYRAEDHSLDQLYRTWLGLDAESFTSVEMQRQVKAICEQSLAAGLTQIDCSSHRLTLHLSSGLLIQYPNPVRYFFENQHFAEQPALCGITHGRVNGSTVLVDREGHTWLIDFSQAGRGPLLRDFVSLEVAVKLDLLETPSIEERYHLERTLLSSGRLDEASSATELSPEASKALALACHIRKLATRIVGPEQEPYLLGLFYCAVARIATFDPTVRHTRRELVPFVHSLLLAAMTGEKLAGVPPVSDQPPAEAQAGLWIDPASQEIWVEGKRIDDLTPQDVTILSYLYERAGRLCTRKDMVSGALQEGYSEIDQEHSRLDSAISRLRRKIEPDPENPKYLVTIRGRGYRLIL